MAILLLAEGS